MNEPISHDDIEWLDIVDQENRIIGAAPRAIVHRKAYMHRAVHVMVFNSAGEVFVQRRSLDKDTNPGLWDTSCAGHIDSGESVLIGAMRELFEELGITVTSEALKECGQIHPSSDNGFEHVGLFTVLSDEKLDLCSREIIDGRWHSLSSLDAWLEREPNLFTTTFSDVWKIFRQHIHQRIS